MAALEQEESIVTAPVDQEEGQREEKAEAITTADELHGYYIVQAILTQVIDPVRVVMRDQKTYCTILLDDNNRKPICRLWFNTSQKYVGLLDAEKKETRVPIASLADIYKLADQLKDTVARFENLRPAADSADPAG